MPQSLPLVYSCSGCSDVAQMANDFALRLAREELAEMSCIAGVGGGVEALLRVARQGRPILALDGCPLHCVRACLASAGVKATQEINLGHYGVRKTRSFAYDPDQAEEVWHNAILPAIAALGSPVAA